MPILEFNLQDRSPFDRVHEISLGATLPELVVRLLDGHDPVDITGATVTFSMDHEDGTSKVVAQSGAVREGADGQAEYLWSSADVDTAGRYIGQFKLVIDSDQYLVPNNDSQKLIIEIKAAI